MVRSSYGGLPRELFENAMRRNPVALAELEKEADELDDRGDTLLHQESSIREGTTEIVGFLVDQFSYKNILFKLDIYGETVLHKAVRRNNFEMVDALINAARRNLPYDSNNPASPFLAFIRHVSKQKGRNTALDLAVIQGNPNTVMVLVDADPSYIHTPNDDGETLIYIAALRGFKHVLKILLTTRTAQSLDGPDGRMTVLHALINDIRRVTEEVIEMIRMIIHAAKLWSSVEDPPHVSFEALFNRTDKSGRTLLELAMEKNYVNVVELVLQEDLAYQRGTKRHGLMRLIYEAIDKEYYSKEIVKLLSETYEAGISRDHRGVLNLILAIKRSDKECVLRLLEDANQLVSFADDEGWTPLHHAAYHGFNSVLSGIIDVQIDVGYQFVYGDGVSTPLLVAAERGYTSTLIRLMQLWPPTSSSAYTAVNKSGRNILLIAAAGNEKEMIRGILDYCPKEFKDKILKQKDDNGDTLLHLLISHGCFIPELILHKELDILAKNKKDWTPRDMLYLEGDIIADQMHIKMALDDVQAKMDSSESKVPPYKRERKDVIFNQRIKLLRVEEHVKKELENEKYLEKYKNRTNTQIIATALITTVTFTVGFTVPGGLHQSGEVDEGLVVLSRKTAFKAFMLSDALGLLFSTSSLLFYFLQSINKDIDQVRNLNASSTVLNIVSIMVMMVTFITGTYVVLSNTPALAITVCGISSLFFLLIIVLSRNIYRTVMYNIRATPTKGVKSRANTIWHDVEGRPC